MISFYSLCLKPSESSDIIDEVFKLKESDLRSYIQAVHNIIVVSGIVKKVKPNINVSKYCLSFDMKEGACLPINKELRDSDQISGAAALPVTYGVVYQKSSHTLLVKATNQKGNIELVVNLNVVYSTNDFISNIVWVNVDGKSFLIILIFLLIFFYCYLDFIYFFTFSYKAELSEILSLEEVQKLVGGQKPLAKSQNPVWKIKWRGIDVVVKCILDKFSAENEVFLHK